MSDELGEICRSDRHIRAALKDPQARSRELVEGVCDASLPQLRQNNQPLVIIKFDRHDVVFAHRYRSRLVRAKLDTAPRSGLSTACG